MINRYINHLNSKPTHERRKHAVQVAAVVSGIIFLGWLGTLGMRLSEGGASVANDTGGDQTQLANVASGVYAQDGSGATLQVASTTNGTDITGSDASASDNSNFGQ